MVLEQQSQKDEASGIYSPMASILVEYVLILALIFLCAIASIQVIGGRTCSLFHWEDMSRAFFP